MHAQLCYEHNNYVLHSCTIIQQVEFSHRCPRKRHIRHTPTASRIFYQNQGGEKTGAYHYTRTSSFHNKSSPKAAFFTRPKILSTENISSNNVNTTKLPTACHVLQGGSLAAIVLLLLKTETSRKTRQSQFSTDHLAMHLPKQRAHNSFDASLAFHEGPILARQYCI